LHCFGENRFRVSCEMTVRRYAHGDRWNGHDIAEFAIRFASAQD
jgi:hypothetical protein